MPDRALCIHAHFGQPPRENPFTGAVPYEPEAEPYRNYTERVHSECYRPNAELGNFELISFSFDPNLARWLHTQLPTTHERIVAAVQAGAQGYLVPALLVQNQRLLIPRVHEVVHVNQ